MLPEKQCTVFSSIHLLFYTILSQSGQSKQYVKHNFTPPSSNGTVYIKSDSETVAEDKAQNQ